MSKRVTQGHGLGPVPSGLPDNWLKFKLSDHFKVIDNDLFTKDADLNERIQREGAHCNGGGDEASWYYAHKGYSERN